MRYLRKIYFPMILLLLALSSSALAQTVENPIAESPNLGTIQVSGRGQVKTDPDVAFVQIGLELRGDDAFSAQQASNKVMQQVIEALGQLGISKTEIQTDYFFLNPDRRYDKETGSEITVGYMAVNQLSITVKDINSLGEVIDTCVKAGANRVHNVRYGIQDSTELENEALTLAIQEATRKAKVLAAASGHKIEHIVSIVENGSYAPGQPVYKMGAMESADMALEPGQIAVQAAVQVIFAIAQ